MLKEKLNPFTEKDTENKSSKKLILLNDDVNTFDHVIESLIEVCAHSEEQAEQCALITHYKGKCQVRSGKKEELLSCKEQLIERMLNAVIK